MSLNHAPAMSPKGYEALYSDMKTVDCEIVDCEVVEDHGQNPLDGITNATDAIAVCDAIANHDLEEAWELLHQWAFPRWLSLDCADSVRINRALSRYHAASMAEFNHKFSI